MFDAVVLHMVLSWIYVDTDNVAVVSLLLPFLLKRVKYVAVVELLV